MTISELRRQRRELLRRSRVYLVTEEALSDGRTSEAIVEAALLGGVRVVQLRDKAASARRAFELGIALRRMTARAGALLLVNDRVDLALAIGADGAHVGQEDLPVAVVRELIGPDALVGLSITTREQLGAPDAADADYLGVGAVFPTGSKDDATLTGLPLLAAARAATDVPIVAIGGIAIDNAAEAVRAGADSLAVISAITRAPDPSEAARRLAAAADAAVVGGRR